MQVGLVMTCCYDQEIQKIGKCGEVEQGWVIGLFIQLLEFRTLIQTGWNKKGNLQN